MTPAPQGVGVFVYGGWEEVIEVTDDDTETIRVLWYTIHPITYRGGKQWLRK